MRAYQKTSGKVSRSATGVVDEGGPPVARCRDVAPIYRAGQRCYLNIALTRSVTRSLPMFTAASRICAPSGLSFCSGLPATAQSPYSLWATAACFARSGWPGSSCRARSLAKRVATLHRAPSILGKLTRAPPVRACARGHHRRMPTCNPCRPSRPYIETQ